MRPFFCAYWFTNTAFLNISNYFYYLNFENLHLKPKHPKSTTILILGISALVSLLLSGCCSILCIISLVLGIMAIVMGKTVKEEINANYPMYNPDSLKEVEAGRIMGIIATILSILFVFLVIILMFIYGIAVLASLFYQNT